MNHRPTISNYFVAFEETTHLTIRIFSVRCRNKTRYMYTYIEDTV